MFKSLGQIALELFPSVPSDREEDFDDFQQRVARRLAVLAAFILLLVLPFFQFLEWFANNLSPEHLQAHALLRTPLAVLALLVLVLRIASPNGAWPRPVLLLIGFALMIMVFSLLLLSLWWDSPYMDTTAKGLIMSIAVTSVMATRGARDLLAIYLLPAILFLASMAVLKITPSDPFLLVYPLLMVIIGVILAESQYRGYVSQYLVQHYLKTTAITDPLTALLNRRGMDGIFEAERARGQRHGHSNCIIMADLDRFKRINDTHGHDVGDEVLQELASRLKAAVRGEDHVARWGGEEFLLLVTGVEPEQAYQVAEKIRLAVSQRPFNTRTGKLSITISLGISRHDPGESWEAAIARADQALYQAKERGRNRSEIQLGSVG